MNDIEIKSIWSDKITKNESEDFRRVVNTVFGDFCSEQYFNAKYIDNIYGPSLIIIAYQDGEPIGTHCLWRNDIDGKKAFHSADSCVIKSDKTNGLFGAMLKIMIDFMEQQPNTLFYTFPNANSFPAFKRMKWHVRLSRKILFFPGLSPKDKLGTIDKEYALWWLKQCTGIFYIKLFNRYYLIKTLKSKAYARVLGYVDKDTAQFFPQSKRLWILYCDGEKTTFYNKRWAATTVVYQHSNNLHVPFWKMDAL